MTEGKGGCGCGQSGMHAHEGADKEKKERKMDQGSQDGEKQAGKMNEQHSEEFVDEGTKKGSGS